MATQDPKPSLGHQQVQCWAKETLNRVCHFVLQLDSSVPSQLQLLCLNWHSPEGFILKAPFAAKASDMGVEMKTAMLGASAVKLHHHLLGSQTPDHSHSSAVQLP